MMKLRYRVTYSWTTEMWTAVLTTSFPDGTRPLPYCAMTRDGAVTGLYRACARMAHTPFSFRAESFFGRIWRGSIKAL